MRRRGACAEADRGRATALTLAAAVLGLAQCAHGQAAHEFRLGGPFPLVKAGGVLDNAGVQRMHGALLVRSPAS